MRLNDCRSDAGIEAASSGMFEVSSEKATNRVDNFARDEQWDSRQHRAARSLIDGSYHENRPLFTNKPTDTMVVVSTGNPTLQFGDIVEVPRLKTIQWGGFWRFLANITLDKRCMACAEDGRMKIELCFNTKLYICSERDVIYAIAHGADVLESAIA